MHHEHGPFWKLASERNGPPMMLMMLAPVACIISIIAAPFHQFGGIRLQPFIRLQAILFFRVLYDGFWLAPGGVKLKMTTSGPNPWFWAQNHGFGPDVVTFGVNLLSKLNTVAYWTPLRLTCTSVSLYV